MLSNYDYNFRHTKTNLGFSLSPYKAKKHNVLNYLIIFLPHVK